MSDVTDALRVDLTPDRLHYSTGELLGADDFRDEQTYHRRQLARALLFLHGSGVVAGLGVWAQHTGGTDGVADEVELRVKPGLAVDRAGRLVEVPRAACLRLKRWYDYIASQGASSEGPDVGDLRTAWRAVEGDAPPGVVVADVFLAFHACERGYTPAFASGPFDALDASQPSRVRDAYELSLVLRTEPGLPEVFDPWSGITGDTPAERLAAARKVSLNLWDALALPPDTHAGAWHENPVGVDPTAVLLARLRLPAGPLPEVTTQPPAPDWSAAAWSDISTNIDHDVRHVLLPPAALRRVLGAW